MRRVDHWQDAPAEVPTHDEETTRFPRFDWDLRTLIAVFPPETPFRFLNLNITTGLTGLPLDRNERPMRAKDAFDLQFCLEGRERTASYKAYHSLAGEVEVREDAVDFSLPGRLRFTGSWPSYEFEYDQPEEALHLEARFESTPGFHWWVRVPRAYSHYTSFAQARLRWSWGARSGEVSVPLLHDHAWGRRLLPVRLPVRLFRYEVLRLPDAGFAISLRCEGPGGLPLRATGLLKSAGETRVVMDRYDCEVQRWDRFDDYLGKTRRMPGRWTGTLRRGKESFVYEATRATQPRPVLGNGALVAFDYTARDGIFGTGEIQGEGYAEQFGTL